MDVYVSQQSNVCVMEREREREYLSSYLFVCVKERVCKFVSEAKQKCVCVCVCVCVCACI